LSFIPYFKANVRDEIPVPLGLNVCAQARLSAFAAPGNMDPKTLLDQIDAAVNNEPQNRVFSPSLCRAAGFDDRALIEGRRFQMLSAE